jgi:hypothetical protein
MTYGELERTLGRDVIRNMETSLGRAFLLAEGEGEPEKYHALLELLTALLAASIITKEYEAAARARLLATRLISLVDQSLSIKETDRRKELS